MYLVRGGQRVLLGKGGTEREKSWRRGSSHSVVISTSSKSPPERPILRTDPKQHSRLWKLNYIKHWTWHKLLSSACVRSNTAWQSLVNGTDPGTLAHRHGTELTVWTYPGHMLNKNQHCSEYFHRTYNLYYSKRPAYNLKLFNIKGTGKCDRLSRKKTTNVTTEIQMLELSERLEGSCYEIK